MVLNNRLGAGEVVQKLSCFLCMKSGHIQFLPLHRVTKALPEVAPEHRIRSSSQVILDAPSSQISKWQVGKDVLMNAERL